MDSYLSTDAWQLTIVLLEGLRFMRPEKSWRPIVSIEIDERHVHETTLGVDGQSVNQRERFIFHDASLNSKVDVHVWHQSQSKKKKKRTLVASATQSLDDLMKKQEAENRLEIRLQCRAIDKKSPAVNRGRLAKVAILRLRLQPPPGLRTTVRPDTRPCSPVDFETSGWPREDEGSSSDSNCGISNNVVTSNYPPTPAASLRRRKRVKGYAIDTDDDCVSVSASSEGEILDTRLLLDDNSYSGTYVDSDADDHLDPCSKPGQLVFRRSSTGEIIRFCPEGAEWVAASSDMLLPRYTEKLDMPKTLTRGEKVMAAMTMYGELSRAVADDEFEAVFKRLQYEWTFIGGLLVALAAVDTAVFSISPDSIFRVDTYARAAIATSSIASGLGIACDAWFLLRYNWADLSTFTTRAKDVFNTYFFFALSARMPAFCMFVACVSLLGFLGLVAFDVWAEGVLVMCFIVGVVMSLQFLVFGAHWCVKRIALGGRVGRAGIIRVFSIVRGMADSGPS